MPSKYDNVPLDSPFFDRRVRLLPCQKENVKLMHDRGASIRSISRMYGVDKRLIQFIIYPERLKKNIELRRERGGSNIYYNREQHTESMSSLRKHKNLIFKGKDACG